VVHIGIIGSNFGVIGLLPAFTSIKKCKVVAIGGRNDWKQILARKDVDAIALAVPPHAQYHIAKAAIMKGIHVFAEKPFTATVSQARELLVLAQKKKVTHGIDFMFPEIAEWKKVKELLEREACGPLQHISVHWDWLSADIRYKRSSWKTNVAAGGGALSFYFSHGLYYLEYFAGEITDMKSLFTYSPESIHGGEVGVDMLLKFKRGATGQAHVSCNSKGRVRHQLVFQCERGVIALENENAVVDNFTVKTYDAHGMKQLKVRKDRGRKNEDERVKIVKKLAARFVNCCISKSQMSPSFKEGLRVQELIEMVRDGSF